jgi:DNA-binding ferritin-like protein
MEDQSVVMKWVHEGAERALTLTQSAGVRHEIYIENTPLYDWQTDELERHEELAEYYKLIAGIEEENRFTLTPVRPEEVAGNDGDFGTPDIPCQVIRLDGPGGG